MERTLMTEAPWRVRVGRAGGGAVGGGVLVAEHTVLTCAHVVAEAGTAIVDFPAQPGMPSREVSTDHMDEQADLALLTVPGDAPAPAPLQRCGSDRVGATIRAYGYPLGLDAGLWRHATIAGAGGPGEGWIQLDNPDEPMSRGFSGAGVLAGDKTVIGIVVARYRFGGMTANWMIPMEECARHFPQIRLARRPRRSDIQQLSRLLLEVPVMRTADSRQLVVDILPPKIAGQVSRFSAANLDVFSLLRTCQEFDGGLAMLVEAVRALDGGTIAFRRFEQALSDG
jgi:S1-C subfamily serine protease